MPSPSLQQLRIAALICFVFMWILYAGGFGSGSIALMTEAANLLADLLAFAVPLAAARRSYAVKEDSAYSSRKVECVAAYLSMTVLFLTCVLLFCESVRTIYDDWFLGIDDSVDGQSMVAVAFFGILAKVALWLVLGRGSNSSSSSTNSPYAVNARYFGNASNGPYNYGAASYSFNQLPQTEQDGLLYGGGGGGSYQDNPTGGIPVQQEGGGDSSVLDNDNNNNEQGGSSFMRVLGDLGQIISILMVGVIIAINSVLTLLDPMVAMAFCVLSCFTAYPVIKKSFHALFDDAQGQVDLDRVRWDLNGLQSIKELHSVQVMSTPDGLPAITVHATATDGRTVKEALNNVRRIMSDQYGIQNVTMQIHPEFSRI